MALAAIGRYQLQGELGRGGAGVVHRAFDPTLGRAVALKLYLGHLLADERGQERFRREGEVLARLDHPGLVRVLDAGVWSGHPWLVCDLVEGARPLADACRGLGLRERVALLRDAARALGHAHERGVLHRDLKSSNVLVGSDGRVRVTDFGAALVEGQATLTESGATVGTPLHMAPEQVTGDRARLGPATDVWGLGVLLYQALTGELPFQAASVPALASQIVREPPRPVRTLAPQIPPALETIVERCLEKDAGRRLARADLLAAALDAWLEEAEAGPGAGAAVPARAARRGAAPQAGALGGVAGLALGLALGLAVAPAPARPAGSTPASPAPAPPAAAPVEPPPAAAVPGLGPEAARALRRAEDRYVRGDLRGARDDLEAALAAAPGYVPALLLRAKTQLKLDATQAAVDDLKRVIALDERHVEARTLLGRLGLANKRHDVVTAQLDRVLELDPESANAWAFRAGVWLQQGDPTRALSDLERALELDPRHADALFNRGTALFDLRRLEEAERSFAASLEVDPGSPMAHAFLGRCRAARGDLPGAKAAFERALQLLPPGDPRHDTVAQWREAELR